ncbi:hypothetical protein [Streptomyces sp. 8L]|uniref:hypothetical protein n=1 Tax=Streptomyces sp. 8L TaxID=2877242 RepID=UPI001CD2EF88|nr:hypothetical protein [Streptomyces sp. 8L]MCA1224178.1 hypothetical protein [Streptomyces sp. 8L]
MDAVRVALLREVLAATRWPSEARAFAGALRSCVVPQGGGLLLVGTRAYEPWHLAAHLVDEAAWSGRPELAPTLVRHEVPPRAPAHLTVGLGRLEAAGRGETLLVVAPGRADTGLLERVHGARRAGATVFSLDGGDPEMRGVAHEILTVPGAGPIGTGPFGSTGPIGTGTTHAAGAGPAITCTAGPGFTGRVYAGTGPGRPRTTGRDAGGDAPRPESAAEADVDFDTVQHLVSAAAGESALPGARGRHRFRDRLSSLADRLTAPPPARW